MPHRRRYPVLWIAHWTTASQPKLLAGGWGGTCWTSWQHSSTGTVPGISGAVDLDRFTGAAIPTTLSVALNDDHRPPVARRELPEFGEIGPPHVALRDHHSVSSRVRRLALDTNGSAAAPTSATTRSTASVTASGEWRAAYSRSAEL